MSSDSARDDAAARPTPPPPRSGGGVDTRGASLGDGAGLSEEPGRGGGAGGTSRVALAGAKRGQAGDRPLGQMAGARRQAAQIGEAETIAEAVGEDGEGGEVLSTADQSPSPACGRGSG